ncbi:MAG: hypothetical protein H0V76_09360 [Blastocatellia bacterium]|nr:hypothetical protein [Blastocatellia bacterium]
MSKKKSVKKNDSPEQVSSEESLARMKSFAERRDKFIAAVKENKDRDLSS